jgi:hypothetical protein
MMKKLYFLFALCMVINSYSLAQGIKGTYAIKNVKTGMLLRVKDASVKNKTPLVAYYPENWKCMTWNFKSTGVNTYQLQNLLTNKTFQPAAAINVNVSLEEQSFVQNEPGQQYEFIEEKKGSYLIGLKGTDLYVTPSDPDGTVNSSIILAKNKTRPTSTGLSMNKALLCNCRGA